MDIIIDTCAIVRLAKGEIISSLNKIFDTVYLPTAVFNECNQHAPTKEFLNKFQFTVKSVKNTLPIKLGQGEKECISLAHEMGIPYIATDDNKAILKAKAYQIECITSFNIIEIAKKTGLIDSVKKSLDTMISQGEGINPNTYKHLLHKNNEA